MSEKNLKVADSFTYDVFVFNFLMKTNGKNLY